MNSHNALLALLTLTAFCKTLPIKIAISGGPGVGKTTIIEELKKLHYQVVPEIYTLLRNKAQQANCLTEFFGNPSKTRWDIINTQKELEDLCDQTQYIFCDRSMVDMIGYADYYNKIKMNQDYFDQIKASTYDLVFFLEPLPENYYQKTDIRKEDYTKALEIHTYLENGYKKLHYHIIHVPFNTVPERIHFILNHIRLYEGKKD